MCSHDPFFGTNKNRILKNGSCERALTQISLIFSKYVQGAPIKVSEFYNEITSKIFGVGNQFRYFWKAETCNYLTR